MSVPPAIQTEKHGNPRATVLRTRAAPLSGLLALPDDRLPRATIVALHGAGMRSGYFHSEAAPGLSLLNLGTALGYTVLALDRPGYGASAAHLPYGQQLAEQAETLTEAVRVLHGEHPSSQGVFLLGHSFGGMVALSMAALWAGDGLLGVDVSGLTDSLSEAAQPLRDGGEALEGSRWGPLRLYPPGTFTVSRALVSEVPTAEVADAARWPDTFRTLAPEVAVPTRFTVGEYERFWHVAEGTRARLRRRLSRAPSVDVVCQPQAGHNISLGWAGRAYHLGAMAFAESCVQAMCMGGFRTDSHDGFSRPAPKAEEGKA